MVQERTRRQRPQDEDTAHAPPKSERIQKKAAEIKADLDKAADTVDDVLEKNADEFVRQYRQAGGE